MAIKLVEIKHERRTFIKGDLRGKYWAEPDEVNRSDSKSDVFNLNVYEAEIRAEEIHKNDQGEFSTFSAIPVTTTKFPSPITVHLRDAEFQENAFQLNLQGIKLIDIVLDKIMTEPNQRFGRIRAKIQGYVLDYISEFVEVEEPEIIPEEQPAEIPTKTILPKWILKTIPDFKNPPKERTDWLGWFFFIVGLLLFIFLIIMMFKAVGWKAMIYLGLIVLSLFSRRY
jgi:hypothetical protein